MPHKSICSAVLAASLFGLSSPVGATVNVTLSVILREPSNYSEFMALPAPDTPGLSGPAGQVLLPARELSELEQTIRELVFSRNAMAEAGFRGEHVEELARAYALRTFRPVWFEDQSLTPLAKHLIDELGKASDHGLDPQAYGVWQLASSLNDIERSNTSASLYEIAIVELQLTRAFAAFGGHLAGGVLEPDTLLDDVYISPRVPALKEMLAQLEERGSVEEFFTTLEPEAPSYTILKEQLVRYNEALTSDLPIYLSDGPNIEFGDKGERVAQLEKRLIAEGYTSFHHGYSGAIELEAPPLFYNSDMQDVVKRFQKRHGLDSDGVVGKKTRAALNVSLLERRNQIIVNLERMRWDDPVSAGRYVKVNVAEQMVRVMEGTQVLYETRSVVGQPKNATPLFSDTFEYAEINPTWGVPWSIATNEYLPKLRNNPAALSGTGINIYKNGRQIDPVTVNWNAVRKRQFSYRLRQKAGRKNALGAVKFMFPNKHNIYLHDTPSKRLFNADQRAFSHGCIRVQDPFTFGEVLLAPSGHSRAKMEKLHARGKTVRLDLSETVPIHLRYYTAFAGADGDLQFREDIYKQDKIIFNALMTLQHAARVKMASSYPSEN